MSAPSLQLATVAASDDLALVHATKRGNVVAFEELVKRYDRKIFRIAQHITRNREDAQDVVQKTFLKAFQKLDQFQENSQFSTWLVRITINQSLMNLRKLHRKREVPLDDDFQTDGDVAMPLEVADWAPNPEQSYEASELRAILIEVLESLQPGLSLAFVLRDIEGLTTEQTAEVMQISQAAIRRGSCARGYTFANG
jgi:RNA polymerase sigma-70 factor (ECF subfamily)